jgi:hypothetical protein
MAPYILVSVIIVCVTLIVITAIKHSCKHEWETIRVIRVFEDGDYSLPLFHRYVLQCKKCGKIKKKII